MDDIGAFLLLKAIFVQARDDYLESKRGSRTEASARYFFLYSPFVDGMGLDGKALMKRLEQMKRERRMRNV